MSDPDETPPRRGLGSGGFGSARAERIARRIAVVTFVVVLGASATLTAFTGYRTGFTPDAAVDFTGQVAIIGCRPNWLQLGTSQLCDGQVVSWDDGSDGAGAGVVVRSRIPVSGTIPVAAHTAFVTVGTGGTQHRSAQHVLMPADQVPLSGGIKILMGLGCFVLAFVVMFVALRLARPRLLTLRDPAPGGEGPA